MSPVKPATKLGLFVITQQKGALLLEDKKSTKTRRRDGRTLGVRERVRDEAAYKDSPAFKNQRISLLEA